ncbi:hypothetical protein BWQ96_02490 [Gracilariopsis chorda]|uniref:Rhodanese domain-containing protein n=1 Tax=Gracilariopsis chorda TaxID=448386 RepID=A0A2V3J097_9FLOR|nr:hypothetical protein BWQ96_02490 [Gracilariopsis chorda]|eukprot:PXF47808.1 hypothetical protein BWQ96_02490 [Gracilariopsis chorda]
MSLSFVASRALFSNRFIPRTNPKRLLVTACSQIDSSPRQTARERRRATVLARINAHKELKQELNKRADNLVSAVVTVPPHVRERCSLTPRLARVKVFLERSDLDDVNSFRVRIRLGLVHIFPELEERELLRDCDGFDIKVGGGKVIQDFKGLKGGLEKCEKAGSLVFVELIPHNTPPPKQPYSERVHKVQQIAKRAQQNPDERLYVISFYKFVNIEKPEVFSNIIRRVWSWMGVRGRVYVATEGVNAQLSIPESVMLDFREAMNGVWKERNEHIVPPEIVGVFLNEDVPISAAEQPFEKLQVKPRNRILADGFDEPLDWKHAGQSVPPEEWHQLLKSSSDDYLLLDCRNDYESDVGRFDGAEPLNTPTFRDSWTHLEKRLENEDRSKRILTYCTGGIRCVKVNAFLEQKLGFTNTGRLQGGIVSYARNLRETGRLNESTFKGVNHVFDGRMGEVITNDLLDQCITCGQSCNIQTDCANVECPRPFDSRIFVQCEDCAKRMDGACSAECLERMQAKRQLSSRADPNSPLLEQSSQCSNSEHYADVFSVDEPPIRVALRSRTETVFGERARMLSSNAQASLLRLLIQVSGAKRVLEIGTFTGYATLAMASGVGEEGLVFTCECDEKAAAIAEEYFAKDHDFGHRIRLMQGRALQTLEALHDIGAEPFKLVFVDADKGGYISYTSKLLEYNLVEVGGLLVFDNVLFRGEVPNVWEQEKLDTPTKDDLLNTHRLKNLKNVRKIADKLHEFNKFLKHHEDLEQIVLPFRDGLTVARRVK